MIFQHTVIVERWWQVPLSKVGSPPRLHPRRHRIYKLVEDLKHAPKEDLELILTQTVPSQYLHHFCEKPKIIPIVSKPSSCAFFLSNWQDLAGEATLCLWKSLMGETNFCLKALLCMLHRRIDKCLLRNWEWATHLSAFWALNRSTSLYCHVCLFFILFTQKLREGSPEDRIQTRTGQLVSFICWTWFVYSDFNNLSFILRGDTVKCFKQ